jgi:hypothetical protein
MKVSHTNNWPIPAPAPWPINNQDKGWPIPSPAMAPPSANSWPLHGPQPWPLSAPNHPTSIYTALINATQNYRTWWYSEIYKGTNINLWI